MHEKKQVGANKSGGRKVKVLYIGHYREGTGWGQAAIDYILSMDAAGIDVVPRAVKLNSREVDLPKRILELESKESLGCDVCVQHVLPHLLDYNSKFKKNIALYATETSNFLASDWARKINTMDEAWVINQQMIESSRDSGVTVPVKVVPHACDFNKFATRRPKLDIPNSQGNFVFYFVGEHNNRKNLPALVKAFHLEFDKNEPVSLLIKTHMYGVSPDDCANIVGDMCNQIKASLKLYPSKEDYKEDLIITDYVSEEDMLRIHQTCDCFVMPSYGEAWCIPAFDAMGFGSTPICSNVGGMSDFLQNGGGFLIDGRWEPVEGMTNTFGDIFTGNEDWYSINVRDLQKQMRNVYEMHKNASSEYSDIKRQGLSSAQDYSYDNVGKIIKELLTDVNN